MQALDGFGQLILELILFVLDAVNNSIILIGYNVLVQGQGLLQRLNLTINNHQLFCAMANRTEYLLGFLA